jgi:ketosteroid isomerase-like protein
LAKFHKEEREKVTEVNDNFYAAMSEQNYELMASTWRKDEFVQFVHEGSSLVRGYDDVMTVFKRMFAPRDKLRKYCIAPEDVKVHVRGHSARVSCVEEVLVSGMGAQPRRKFTATNLFRKVGKKWKLVHHHASLVLPRGSSSSSSSRGQSESSGPRITTLGNG